MGALTKFDVAFLKRVGRNHRSTVVASLGIVVCKVPQNSPEIVHSTVCTGLELYLLNMWDLSLI